MGEGLRGTAANAVCRGLFVVDCLCRFLSTVPFGSLVMAQ
jgi:hypothetical protein